MPSSAGSSRTRWAGTTAAPAPSAANGDGSRRTAGAKQRLPGERRRVRSPVGVVGSSRPQQRVRSWGGFAVARAAERWCRVGRSWAAASVGSESIGAGSGARSGVALRAPVSTHRQRQQRGGVSVWQQLPGVCSPRLRCGFVARLHRGPGGVRASGQRWRVRCLPRARRRDHQRVSAGSPWAAAVAPRGARHRRRVGRLPGGQRRARAAVGAAPGRAPGGSFAQLRVADTC